MVTHIATTLVGMMFSPVQLSHGYLYSAGKHGSPVNLLNPPERPVLIASIATTVHKKNVEGSQIPRIITWYNLLQMREIITIISTLVMRIAATLNLPISHTHTHIQMALGPNLTINRGGGGKHGVLKELEELERGDERWKHRTRC